MVRVKQMMVSSILSSALVLLLINCLVLKAYAAPQAAGAASASGGAGASGAAAGASGASGAASTTISTTTTSSTTTGSSGATTAGTAGAGAAVVTAAQPAGMMSNGIQGIVGGAMNIASMPLNTITASLNQLGLPTIATAPLSAVSNLFQQAGTVYGR